ncbi:MAG: hypothetical protein NTU53_08725 [Planctomycetota bacterium]|nr:hypothetical protein [Planctomycetota bacterium]
MKQPRTPAHQQECEGSTVLKERDDAGRAANFYSLHHTVISRLAAAGMHPKTAQMLAQHFTITLTMDRYTHIDRGEEAAAVASLPGLPVPPAEVAQAMGTHDLAVGGGECPRHGPAQANRGQKCRRLLI